MLKKEQIQKLKSLETEVDSLKTKTPVGYTELIQRVDRLEREMTQVMRLTLLVEAVLVAMAALIMIKGAELSVMMTIVSISVILLVAHTDPRKFIRIGELQDE